MRRVLDLQRILAPCRPQHGQRAARSEVRRDRRRIERRRHHDDLQIRPARTLQPPQQRQREIAFQMPLVEFVEHHAPHALQSRVAQHAAREHALGQEAQPRTRSRYFFEAHLIADRAARRLAAFARDDSAPPGARPGGAAPAPALRAHPVRAARAERAWSSPPRAALPAPGGWRCAGDCRISGSSSSMGRRTRASIVAIRRCSGARLPPADNRGDSSQELFQHEGGLSLLAAPQMDLREENWGCEKCAGSSLRARSRYFTAESNCPSSK